MYYYFNFRKAPGETKIFNLSTEIQEIQKCSFLCHLPAINGEDALMAYEGKIIHQIQ